MAGPGGEPGVEDGGEGVDGVEAEEGGDEADGVVEGILESLESKSVSSVS